MGGSRRLALLAAPALATLRLASAQAVSVTQPDTPGLQLIGFQSPAFAAAVAPLVSPQTLQQLAAYMPFAVVFKNASNQPLLEYTIRWAAPDPKAGGTSVGWSSPRNPSTYLQPGAAVLVVPNSILTADPGPQNLRIMLENRSQYLSTLQAAQTIAISLDAAILASGQFVGPDANNLFAKDAAYCTAWRTVDREVQGQIADGVPFVTIAAHLQEIRDAPFSDPSAPSHDWIARAQSQEARQLIGIYDRRGAQAVTDRINRNLATPEIVVHR